MAPDPLERLLQLAERIKPVGPSSDLILEMKDQAARIRLAHYREQHPEIAAAWNGPCHTRRENDEYACSCGRRWPVEEGEDHP